MPNSGEQFATLQAELEELREDVKDLTKSTKALVEAWNTATNVVKFVKVLATIMAALSAVYFYITHGFTTKPGG